MDWFRVAEYEPGVHLIAEPGYVASWLIHGRDRDVLLDTGHTSAVGVSGRWSTAHDNAVPGAGALGLAP